MRPPALSLINNLLPNSFIFWKVQELSQSNDVAYYMHQEERETAKKTHKTEEKTTTHSIKQ